MRMRDRRERGAGCRLAGLILAGWLIAGCSETAPPPSASEGVSDEVAAQSNGWRHHGRTETEARFSPLDLINEANVGELKLAWYLDLPTQRGQEATPLVVDGVMYTSTAWSHVLAVDPVSGKQLWHFDPQVPGETAVKACCDVVNRGVAYLDGRVFVGTLDGRLIALDARTGKPVWSVVTVDQSKHYTITGAPRVVNGKVFIGNGGAEFGVRGYLSAYDADTGDLVWRFYTVPGAPGGATGTEPVASQTATWNGEWWKLGGGGTVWDSMAYDEDANILYFGVGNGSPWNPNLRTAGLGDNWFLSSIVAVDADTGEYKWHYQTTPGEAWDFTATQHMILADIEIRGELRKVIMQAPKNGFFYVIDRITGELISAEKYVPASWASHVDIETGRPVVNPEAEYWKTGQASLVTPAMLGGHNWHPMSFSADTGLIYLPAQVMAFPYVGDDDMSPKQLAVNLGIDTTVARLPDDPEVVAQLRESTRGQLLAWNPITQKEVWRVEYPGAWNGGVLSTGGNLVFQGSATGYVNAYRATDGKALWQFPAQTGVVAPPMTYMVNGEQYVTVNAGWGGVLPLLTGPLAMDATNDKPVNRSRLLTFKLGGTAQLPPTSEQAREMPDMSSVKLNAEQVDQGFVVYDRFCGGCHGAGAVGGGVTPDLRYSAFLQNADGFKQVVLDGILSDRGMVGFGSEISADEGEAIRAYLISTNQYARRTGDTSRLSR